MKIYISFSHREGVATPSVREGVATPSVREGVATPSVRKGGSSWLIQTLENLENLENSGKKISLENTGKTQGKTVLLWKNEILSPT